MKNEKKANIITTTTGKVKERLLRPPRKDPPPPAACLPRMSNPISIRQAGRGRGRRIPVAGGRGGGMATACRAGRLARRRPAGAPPSNFLCATHARDKSDVLKEDWLGRLDYLLTCFTNYYILGVYPIYG